MQREYAYKYPGEKVGTDGGKKRIEQSALVDKQNKVDLREGSTRPEAC